MSTRVSERNDARKGRRRCARLGRYAAIFAEGLRVAFSNAVAYRANLVMTMLIVFLGNIAFPFITALIYGAGASFPGWTFWEVLLVQSLFTVSSGISGIFFGGVFWQTNFGVREGTFEIPLLKPVDTLFYLVASSIQFDSLGTVIGGLAMLALALVHVSGVTAMGATAALVLFAGGVCVQAGVTVIMAATAFRWVGNSRIPEIFDSLLNFGKYPQGIFPQGVRAVTSFALPVAMIGFFPAEALLGRARIGHFLSLAPCVLFLAAGILLYRRMIHRYEGVGG
jgi:ABC-2 type transport system permease protein